MAFAEAIRPNVCCQQLLDRHGIGGLDHFTGLDVSRGRLLPFAPVKLRRDPIVVIEDFDELHHDFVKVEPPQMAFHNFPITSRKPCFLELVQERYEGIDLFWLDGLHFCNLFITDLPSVMDPLLSGDLIAVTGHEKSLWYGRPVAQCVVHSHGIVELRQRTTLSLHPLRVTPKPCRVHRHPDHDSRSLLAQFGLTPKSRRGLGAGEV